MQALTIDVLFGLCAAMTGAAGTWWLCGRQRRPQSQSQSKEKPNGREAAEVLARLHELATRVAIDVGEHANRVEEINEELTSSQDHEAAGIVDVVAKLVQANQQMQTRLSSTEDKLREQAQEIECHATEARTDALTLLSNRRAFDAEMARRFSEFQRHGTAFSLMMIDVDHFKKFNDTYGHQAGDEVLRGVARVLRRKTREMDLPARYGGEEFAVILPGTAVDEACPSALRIREAIEKARFNFEGQQLQVTTSLGVAELLPDEDGAGLIKRADEALYASKEAGRNCVHWHDGERCHPAQPAKDSQPQSARDDGRQETVPSAVPGKAEQKEQKHTASRQPDAPKPRPVTIGPEEMDKLAEVVNRSVFCQHVRSRLAEWKRGGATLSVLLVELDQYEQLSSHRNREVSEAAVRAATVSVVSSIRDMDLAGQYSPECVALLLPSAGLADAIRAAERLRESVSRCAVRLGNGQLPITASVAVVEAAKNDGQVELLQRAESALSSGRSRGGNCTYYHDGERCAPITALLQAMDYLA